MAIIFLVCIAVTVASAAPANSEGAYRDWEQELFDRTGLNKLQEVYPAKRSNYGGLYVSPCAAAASAYTQPAAVPAYPSPVAPTPYSYGHPAYHPVPGHHGHYGHPYYRTEDELESEQEMMGFADMNQASFNHVPTARYSYGAAPTAQLGGGTGAGQIAASGPVVGVFSNANVGGCSVPLLVSCTPSIAHGQLKKSQPYYNSVGYPGQQGNVYRGVEEHPHRDEAEGLKQNAAHLSSESPHISNSIGEKHQ